MANSVGPDEVAHYEPPHQYLRCLGFQLFLSLVLKKLRADPIDKEDEKMSLFQRPPIFL